MSIIGQVRCFIYSIKFNSKVVVYNYLCIITFVFSGISWPMTKAQLPLFERNNPSLIINLLEWCGEKDEENPVRILRPAPCSNDMMEKTIVSILAVEISNDNWHYVGVTNIDRLLNTSGNPRTYCERCLKPLFYGNKGETRTQMRQDHLKVCMMTNPDPVKMTDKVNLQFESFGKTQRLPYVMYADTECILSIDQNNASITHHTPCAIGLLLVPHPEMKADPLSVPYTTFTGKDCMLQACDFIEDVAKQVYAWNESNSHQSVSMSSEQKHAHSETFNCYLCNCGFTDDVIKVVEHDHLTGKFYLFYFLVFFM